MTDPGAGVARGRALGDDDRARPGARPAPTIHQAAYDNLRRAARPVLVLFGAVFALMALFAAGSFVVVRQNLPSAPSGAGASAGPGPEEAGGTGARKAAVADFLEEAAGLHGDAVFPGRAAARDGLTYTPRSSGDPGAGRPDGLAHVPYHGLPAADAEAVLTAVSRDGTVRPGSLAVSESSGTDRAWVVEFVVKVRTAKGDDWLEGRAEGYTGATGATVIRRLVYPSVRLPRG